MLSRRHPMQLRLMRAFGLFSGSVLLLTWLIGLCYFLIYERNELLETLESYAAIIATQSSAAVLFDDTQAMTENLGSLRHVENLEWATILVPATQNQSDWRIAASFGTPPDNLDRYAVLFATGQTVNAEGTGITLRQGIEVNGTHRAELLLHIDLQPQIMAFIRIALLSLVLNLGVLALAIWFFQRIVGSISRPLEDLLQLVSRVEKEGIPAERADSRHPDEIGRLGLSFNRMLDGLAERERALAESLDSLRALSQRLQAVREEERTRISHEIHDELGQRMTSLKFEVARLQDEPGRERLGAMIDATIKVVRSIAWELRPGLLDTVGLEAAIEWLGQDFRQRMGIRCGIELPGAPVHLSPAQSTDLFRICQELLTNIARHAKASRADIRLRFDGKYITLCVSDNGVGMSPKAGAGRSLGLLGIRERVRRWHGRMDITQTNQDGGVTVFVEIPAVPVIEERQP